APKLPAQVEEHRAESIGEFDALGCRYLSYQNRLTILTKIGGSDELVSGNVGRVKGDVTG
ncbi:MAG: hypothetical protein M3312_03370, partial [Actinomycetota bacterium]|nr:hypothetical protein [Actinomycetota bacterium]